MESQSVIKCQKCRNILVNHFVSVIYKETTCSPQNCESYDTRKLIYLLEDQLPPWIKSKIVREEWTKGKLHCENCGFKVGSFDFVSGRKCECGMTVLPPVHFISSQVDKPIFPNKIS